MSPYGFFFKKQNIYHSNYSNCFLTLSMTWTNPFSAVMFACTIWETPSIITWNTIINFTLKFTKNNFNISLLLFFYFHGHCLKLPYQMYVHRVNFDCEKKLEKTLEAGWDWLLNIHSTYTMNAKMWSAISHFAGLTLKRGKHRDFSNILTHAIITIIL